MGSLAAMPTQAAEVITSSGCIKSVPEPGTTAPVDICYSLFQPASASAESPVPLIFHSHGWGGSRSTSAGSFTAWLDAGFGVLSFDQRGFGASGGKAHVENPSFEGEDVTGLVDLVAGLDWVAKDEPGDPVIGAIGGSYGGGYQMVGAFTDLMKRGKTRFNALAPEITWYDLQDSLAPSFVPRTLWVSLLFAAGTDAHTDTVIKGFAYGAATGQWAGSETDAAGANMTEFFRTTGPKWHVDNGRLLDIPVVFGQGITDNLFNLNQGINIFDKALTTEARSKSILVGYNGGHVLPSVVPVGAGTGGDPCSRALAGGSFATLARRFFTEELKGVATGLGGRGQYHLATADGSRCQTVASAAPSRQFAAGTIATNVGPGVAQHVKLADGPLTVAGMPHVTASVTSGALEGRAFFALSVGTSPADAKIVQNNMLPLREALPVVGAARTIELPGVAVDVPAGQSLFLTVSPFSDMSFGHGSRAPGALVLQNVVAHVPVV